MVKGPPWRPSIHEYNANHSLVAQDFELLASIGVNTLRLGVIWQAVEPIRGIYNETYIDELVQIVRHAGEFGIYTLLDFHQVRPDRIKHCICMTQSLAGSVGRRFLRGRNA